MEIHIIHFLYQLQTVCFMQCLTNLCLTINKYDTSTVSAQGIQTVSKLKEHNNLCVKVQFWEILMVLMSIRHIL